MSRSLQVFIHELGHSFAFLADEYEGNVAYNDMYPRGVEPLDPNITEMLDPANLKWKALLTPGVPLPTPSGQAEITALRRELRSLTNGMSDGPDQGPGRGRDSAPGGDSGQIVGLANRVGAFEGAGYLKTGMYRPQQDCIMRSGETNFARFADGLCKG